MPKPSRPRELSQIQAWRNSAVADLLAGQRAEGPLRVVAVLLALGELSTPPKGEGAGQECQVAAWMMCSARDSSRVRLLGIPKKWHKPQSSVADAAWPTAGPAAK